MSYQSDTVASIVRRLNDTHFLPAIQREFVWGQEQIIKLFDSLLRDYPIQTFLFWEVDRENRTRWDIYKFIDQFSQKNPHNPAADPSGVQNLVLVLDGQQRLTALLIGLKGSFTVKKKHKRRTSADAWLTQALYINLLHDPDDDSEVDDSGITYGLEFHATRPEDTPTERWIRVGDILDCASMRDFQRLMVDQQRLIPEGASESAAEVVQKNMMALYGAICTNSVISYRSERVQELDHVLDIFVRVNEGGTKLSKSDLLLSTVTAHWEDVNAREEIYSFVDRINNELPLRNSLDKDFIMKSSLVLSDLDVKYRVDNFGRDNIQKIQEQWPAIKSCIESGMRLVNSFGVDENSLTSANALIPIMYFLSKHPRFRVDGTSSDEVRNQQSMRRWLAQALLTGAFGRASDNVLTSARNVLKVAETDDFPIEALNRAIYKGSIRQDVIDAVIDSRYQERTIFLALALVYDQHRWTTPPHQDHIFPQSLFTSHNLRRAGIASPVKEQYQDLQHSIANLELISSMDNLEKSNQHFEDWIATRDADFRARHLIPDDTSLYTLVRFPEFIEEREQMIRERLNALFRQ